MREIKFRGRVKNTNKPQWVYGIVIPPQYSSWEDWTLFDGERRWIVDPETVGQYTGYKDVDGKEIYEGDILETPDVTGDEMIRMIVKYGEHSKMQCRIHEEVGFYIEFVNNNWNDIFRHDFLYWQGSKVVGNIHDNPELLKGEEK